MLTHYPIVLSIILQVVNVTSSCLHCHPSNCVIFGEKKKTVVGHCTCLVFALYAIKYFKLITYKEVNF